MTSSLTKEIPHFGDSWKVGAERIGFTCGADREQVVGMGGVW